MGTTSMMTKAEDKQTVTVHTVKEPMFMRDFTKNEAGIKPDEGSTIAIAKQKEKFKEIHAFENQVNSRVQAAESEFQKFTFAGKETFD
jgi:hypothetical protein